MILKKDINNFLKTLPKDITLVVASKYINVPEMQKLLFFGVNNFGENRVDSFLKKYELLKNENIIWHFIGHLQRNKMKLVINKIDVLESLDSLSLAELIEKYREKPLDTFIEVSINEEENKNGIKKDEVIPFIKQILPLKKINLVGLMMMAKDNIDGDEAYKEFKELKDLKDKIEKELNISLPYLSMGMSKDYIYALKAGSTHIRLGRILFDEGI